LKLNLHYIALLPADDVSLQLRRYQAQAKARFGVCSAMRSLPHLTLIPPVRLDELQLTSIKSRLSSISAKTSGFYLASNGWDHFSQHCIYLSITTSEQLLDLNNNLELSFKHLICRRQEVNFTPHISLVTRDINHSKFAEIYQWVQNLGYPALVPFLQLVVFSQTATGWQIAASNKL
jgi:2'-5' RNA ligase